MKDTGAWFCEEVSVAIDQVFKIGMALGGASDCAFDAAGGVGLEAGNGGV